MQRPPVAANWCGKIKSAQALLRMIKKFRSEPARREQGDKMCTKCLTHKCEAMLRTWPQRGGMRQIYTRESGEYMHGKAANIAGRSGQ